MPPSKLSLISDDDFTRFVSNSTSWFQIASKCSLDCSYEQIKRRVRDMKLNTEHIMPPGAYHATYVSKFSDQEFIDIIASSTTWNQVALKCGHQWGTAIKHAKKRAIAMKLDTEHIEQRCTPFESLQPHGRSKHPRRCRNVLRRRLLESGVLEICQWCRCENMELDNGQWLWHGKPLRLEIDHIHGRSNPPSEWDDRLDNLRFLCPLCHSQTHNHPHTYRVNPPKKLNKHTKVITESGREYICELCKCEHMEKGWNGCWLFRDWPCKLQVDHIDGDNSNNDISNLRWLCAQCHSTTDTYRGRNIKRKREQR